MLVFTKMNGAGNDFVLLDNRKKHLALPGEQIAQLCDRHRGIGADGVLIVEEPESGADFRMRYYNSDGGEADMCGNGARCFARYASRLTGGKSRVSFETLAGIIHADCLGNQVRIQMSKPHSHQSAVSLEVNGQTLEVHSINTGVPHAVIFVDDLENTSVHELGNAIRFHPHFAPKGTNVNFVKASTSSNIAIRTYERGVEAETLACGTGVVASALIHHLAHGAAAPVMVSVRGGDNLEVLFKGTAEDFNNVTLTGPADFVFDGTIDLS
ncbi:MAG: diaminopimelate epimerase [Chthoniobacterales bacterium]